MDKRIYRLSPVQRLLRPQGALIITSDEEMEALGHDPTMQVRAFDGRFGDLAKGLEGIDGSLINVAYDFFFGGSQRDYFPTSPECIAAFKALHDVARVHGVGFGASVLSPLDLGPGYYRAKGRGGSSHQFQEGLLQPDGSYTVPLRVQRQWFHNKGPVPLHVHGVRVFAFHEERVGNSSYYAVRPENIVEISSGARLEVDEASATTSRSGYGYANGLVTGRAENVAGLERVLAVVLYDVEEMDYFDADALPFLTGMLDAHKAAGITYDSFYSDEMHIQFDWDLRTHFGPTEITTRYVTPGLVETYCARHGAQYADFDRYLVYFAYAQHGFLHGDGEPEPAQHVFGPDPAAIYATWKFRRDYFRLLTDHVVDLFLQAKHYGEQIFDRPAIWTRAHATWQEAPTCDHVNAAWKPEGAPVSRYDYTPAYEWSSSIRENTSACYDYFRWGDYLTGMGNDHPEGGYIDRCYNGAALAASFGAFNAFPYGYWGHWGAPAPVSQRVLDVAAAYGLGGPDEGATWVQDWQHRHTPVLALYPLDLNHVEERYGSWMVQYGYCDYLTEEKLVEMAQVTPDGHLRIAGREYSTLVVLYQPMIQRATLELLRAMVAGGGIVLWTGPAAAIYREDGARALEDWEALFGLQSVQEPCAGRVAENGVIAFQGTLGAVPAFRAPTHLLPDRIYPVLPAQGTETVSTIELDGERLALGSRCTSAAGGQAVYLGARPRDDQSGSTPDAPRTLYHLLRALGGYCPDGAGWAEIASHSGPLLVCEAPNGAVSVTHHYYAVEESWTGGFFRPEGETFDESVLPPSRLSLRDTQVGHYRVSYQGERVLSFRLQAGTLAAFSGRDTQGIEIDGRRFELLDQPADLTYAPVPSDQLEAGIARAWVLRVRATRTARDVRVRLPFSVRAAHLLVDAQTNGRGALTPIMPLLSAEATELCIPPAYQGLPLVLFTSQDA